jgi:hypothetical protein
MNKKLAALLSILCSSASLFVYSQGVVIIPNEDTIVSLMKRDHVPIAGICSEASNCTLFLGQQTKNERQLR